MTTQTTTTSPTRDVRRFELTLTILGAVCSAVVTGVLAAENVSTTGKLVGMALGAALPPLVGAVGPGRSVRVGVAVVMTVVAVFMAYWGGQLFAKVSETEPPLPTPNEIVTSLGGDTGSGRGGGGDGGEGKTEDVLVQGDGPVRIQVEPGSITCEAEAGCGLVTVTSVGTAPLRIDNLEFEGDAGSYLTADGCENTVLAPNEHCAITLQFSSELAPESATTHLVIHQNLPLVPTLVPLEAHGELSVEPNLALGQPACDRSGLTADPDGGVSGELSIEAPLSATGPADVSSVEAAVYVDGEQWWFGLVDLNDDTVLVHELYVGPLPGEVLVRIDPDNLVQESEDEKDNVAVTSC
jgi:hypothetical protein